MSIKNVNNFKLIYSFEKIFLIYKKGFTNEPLGRNKKDYRLNIACVFFPHISNTIALITIKTKWLMYSFDEL